MFAAAGCCGWRRLIFTDCEAGQDTEGGLFSGSSVAFEAFEISHVSKRYLRPAPVQSICPNFYSRQSPDYRTPSNTHCKLNRFLWIDAATQVGSIATLRGLQRSNICAEHPASASRVGGLLVPAAL